MQELFRDASGRIPAFEWDRRLVSWRNFFLVLDRLFKWHEKLPWKPLRQRALRKAKQWLLEHLERTEGLGAIYPAMVNSVFALRALGYSTDDPVTAREIGHLAQFEIEEGDTLRMQPCVSPVWDTAVTMFSLQEAGLPPDHPALVKAASWLLDHQVLGGGDWQVNNPDVDPGGWAFEFRNDFYPDVDDTAFVLMALQRVAYPDPARLEQALRRGTAWVLSMQNRDGGWGAFDRDNDSAFLTRVPFADHNAMIDPSTGDLTARVLEYLGRQQVARFRSQDSARRAFSPARIRPPKAPGMAGGESITFTEPAGHCERWRPWACKRKRKASGRSLGSAPCRIRMGALANPARPTMIRS